MKSKAGALTWRRVWDTTNDKHITESVSSVSEAGWATFNLNIFVRNNKTVSIEVRNPRLAFGRRRKDAFEVDVIGPIISGQGVGFKRHQDVRLIAIPGEQSKLLKLNGGLEARALKRLPTRDRVDFVAIYGNGKVLRHRVAAIKVYG